MYDYAKQESDDLKAEMKVFMKCLLNYLKEDCLYAVILREPPCLKVFNFFIDATKERKNKSVIVISDSTTTKIDENCSDVTSSRGKKAGGKKSGGGEFPSGADSRGEDSGGEDSVGGENSGGG
ncbi:hypothetical protein ACS0TY_021847 [Phlomoides rotata]